MAELSALVQVVLVDLVLAGDNAIVVGIAVAGLPLQQRWRVMVLGIAAATLLRIVFAAFTVQLLQIIGLLLAGGAPRPAAIIATPVGFVGAAESKAALAAAAHRVPYLTLLGRRGGSAIASAALNAVAKLAA